MISNQAGLGLGDKVHTEEINEYPEELKQDFLELSRWVRTVARQYGRVIVIRVIDPQSLVGMWKTLRHRIRTYPTFILEGNEKFPGWNAEGQLHERIYDLLAARGITYPGEEQRLPAGNFPALHDY
jgi:hypothetical protein